WLNAHVLRVAETGSSDAHHAELVGTAWTEFTGTTPDELRSAILAKATKARGRQWTLREHVSGGAEQQYRSMVSYPAQAAWRRRHVTEATRAKRKKSSA